jgi:type IV pilus assembly protein PilF
MRLDRVLGCLGAALALGGCVASGSPRSSRGDQAEEGARVHTELGRSYLQNGDLKGAQDKLNQALQFDPNYVPAHTLIALLDERINDQAGAELHYRKAVELEPAKGDNNNNLGAFLCKEGKIAESLPYFRKAVADPFYQTPDVAWTNAGTCQAMGATPDNAAAEADFRQALALNPNNGEALFQIAKLLYLRNDAFRARAFIQRYDALGQSSPAALKLGHDIESRLGNKDAALDYARRLQSLFPDSEQTHAIDATASP